MERSTNSLSDRVDADEAEAVGTARLHAALAHPSRLRILHALSRCGCACCAEVTHTIGAAQSTTSQHLACLLEAGLITREQAGAANRYRLAPAAAERLRHLAAGIAALADHAAKSERRP